MPTPDQPRQPRARGSVSLTVRRTGRGCGLGKLNQSGSLRALFPRGGEDAVQAVLLNTAGGATGGDRFSVSAHAEDAAVLTLTTQAAERAYRAAPGETARIENRLCLGAGSRLHWLPQETILFEGCALSRRLTAEMAADATLLLCEPLVFGRAAMGERLGSGYFQDRIEVRRGGTPLYLDAMTLEGDIAGHLARPTVAGGAGAMATLVFVTAGAEGFLDPVRALLPETAGASLLNEDVLVMRGLAPDSHLLRRFLVPVLNLLTGDGLPRPWTI